jgi:hypothetical protein
LHTCENLAEGMIHDIPNLEKGSFECPCPSGFRKIFAAVSDEKTHNDFHFWRLDTDAYWSHKVGSNPPSRLDADRKLITNPLLSNRNFPSHNYSQSCGFYCVPDYASEVKIDEN